MMDSRPGVEPWMVLWERALREQVKGPRPPVHVPIPLRYLGGGLVVVEQVASLD